MDGVHLFRAMASTGRGLWIRVSGAPLGDPRIGMPSPLFSTGGARDASREITDAEDPRGSASQGRRLFQAPDSGKPWHQRDSSHGVRAAGSACGADVAASRGALEPFSESSISNPEKRWVSSGRSISRPAACLPVRRSSPITLKKILQGWHISSQLPGVVVPSDLRSDSDGRQ